jgi:hypothetical protein
VSIQDETQLRVRLGTLLGDIDPCPAPVTAVVRQGRGIRQRRRALAAGGVAVIAAGVVVAPSLLYGQRTPPSAGPPPPPPHYSVRVSSPAAGAGPGVIATGSINGWHWQATLSGSGSKVTARFGDFASVGSVSAALPSAGQYAAFDGASDNAGHYAYVGPVAQAVRYLTVSLSNGQTLTLYPRAWAGHRYVAMVLPQRLEVGRAVAYGAHGELGYSIPFNDVGFATFQTWLPPGRRGLAATDTDVGAGGTGRGHWLVQAFAGPWGLCERAWEPGGGLDTSCATVGTAMSGLVTADFGGGVGRPETGRVRLDVESLLVTMTNGSVVRVRAAHLDGLPYGLVAMIRPAASGVRGWIAYDAHGRRLGSGRGDPLSLP